MRHINIQMIVTDLDRTLLRSDRTISDYTVDVLKRCRERGVRVAFATARRRKRVTDFIETVRVDAVISVNGAVVYVDDEPVIEHVISEETKLEFIRDLHDAGIKLAAESPDAVYSNRHEPGYDRIIWDFTEAVPVPINRISIRHDNHEQVLSLAGKYDDLRVYSVTGETIFDIDPAAAGKYRGVERLAEHFDIPMSEIIAFGDDFNDVEMLEYAGIGVAVANACEEARQAADYICQSNDEDGMAKWLEEHVLPD